MARAAHIATGDELLEGRTVDLNSAALARRLTADGHTMVTAVTVGDDRAALAQALEDLTGRVDIVVISGGLGPTDDDITRETLAQRYDLRFAPDPSARERMTAFFASLQRDMSDADLKMIMVPDGAAVLENTRGLAPGFAVDCGPQVVAALPGVPEEAAAMIDGGLSSYLKRRFPVATPKSRIQFRIVAMKESTINALVNDLLDEHGALSWGVTAQQGIMTVSFTIPTETAMDAATLRRAMEDRFGTHLLQEGSASPEAELLSLLGARGWTLGLAESCTGGLVAKRMTDVPGASSGFRGAIVAYANETKMRMLGVPSGVLSQYGAVSEETARLMATAARERLDADVGAAVTGIAGPDGGSAEKPVGTVWFSFDINGSVSAFKLNLTGSREWIRSRSALVIIDYLRRALRIS